MQYGWLHTKKVTDSRRKKAEDRSSGSRRGSRGDDNHGHGAAGKGAACFSAGAAVE